VELSVYNINFKGVLCYSGLPTGMTNVEFDDHNGRELEFNGIVFNDTHYEVDSIGECGLLPNENKKFNAVF